MVYDSLRHHRRSLRLRGYDYSLAGAYFVTLCTQERSLIFGDVVDGELRLNDIGRAVSALWAELPTRFAGVDLDEWILMPNHLHGVIVLPSREKAEETGPTLGAIVRTFKAVATRNLRAAGLEEFAWQRNYYEHVIRNEADLSRVQRYIVENPAHWHEDNENPSL